MSEYADQVWQWLYEPLLKLKDESRSDPATSWEHLLPPLLDQLGLQNADDNPVVSALDRHMLEQFSSDDDRARFLAGDEIDTFVYHWAEEVGAQYAPQPEPVYAEPVYAEPVHAEPVHAEAAPAVSPREPADVADEAVRELALPVLRELAGSSPVLAEVPTPELIDMLARVLAERLDVARAS